MNGCQEETNSEMDQQDGQVLERELVDKGLSMPSRSAGTGKIRDTSIIETHPLEEWQEEASDIDTYTDG